MRYDPSILPVKSNRERQQENDPGQRRPRKRNRIPTNGSIFPVISSGQRQQCHNRQNYNHDCSTEHWEQSGSKTLQYNH